MTPTLAILGGCGGIGRVLVSAAEAQGYQPIVLDLEASIARHPPSVLFHPVDATSSAALENVRDALPDNLAGFVSLAGFMHPPEALAHVAEANWDEVISGNLKATFLAATILAPKLADKASIVLTGSGLGHYARPGFGSYAISKAGIAAMTRQLAIELAPKLRVNFVAPSAVNTAFLRGGTGRSDEASGPPIDVETYAKMIPLGRIAEPEDITGPILFLLSDAARYVTGQVLHVNGGNHMP
ncbi:MAG: SDR family oxidoreductase [Pseudomonadota bacterium]